MAVGTVCGLIALLLIGVRGLKVLDLGVVGYLHFLIRIIRVLDLGPVDVCPDGTEFDAVIWETHTGWTAGWDACWSKEVSREDRSWVLTSFAIKVTHNDAGPRVLQVECSRGCRRRCKVRSRGSVPEELLASCGAAAWADGMSRLGGARSRGCAVVARRREGSDGDLI